MAPSSILRFVSFYLSLASIVSTGTSAISADAPFAPDPNVVRDNAFYIFGAVHSAMRQWPSSLNHNGLSVFPATVPKGTLFYHGTPLNHTPPYPEWLAFEPQHSEAFARSIRNARSPHNMPPPKSGSPKEPGPGRPPKDRIAADVRDGTVGSQLLMGQATTDDGDLWPPEKPIPAWRGYLHTYQTNRDLKLLYLDGMSAGKTDMGTLDTQDFLLRGHEPGDDLTGPMAGERARAGEICDLVQAWDLDGVIRMEIGFEIIFCNFSSGLDLVSMMRRPFRDSVPGDHLTISLFDWARAVSHRYDGIGAERVALDYSGMVSGLFYPINLTNPNPERTVQQRMIGVTAEEFRGILSRVEAIAKEPRPRGHVVDWQGVVDQIIWRYSDVIAVLASDGVPEEDFVSEVLVPTTTFIDDPSTPYDSTRVDNVDDERRGLEDAIERCTIHYIQPAMIKKAGFTPEDELIYIAIETVTKRICADLYAIRGLLLEISPDFASTTSSSLDFIISRLSSDDVGRLSNVVVAGRDIMKALQGELKWPTWKKCIGCKVNEVCFVAMWPFGTTEDHFSPTCLNRTELNGRIDRHEKNYWRLDDLPSP